MGLIAAALNAAGGVLADTWKEFFTCDAIDDEVLAVRGQKKVSGRSSKYLVQSSYFLPILHALSTFM